MKSSHYSSVVKIIIYTYQNNQIYLTIFQHSVIDIDDNLFLSFPYLNNK